LTSPTTADLTLHPWNDAFSWQPTHRPLRFLDEAQATHFDDNGFVVLKGALDVSVIDEVRQATDAFEEKREAQLAADGGRSGISQKGSITFAEHLAAQSDVLRRLARHPVLAAVCADLVGENVNLYWDQAVYKQPERPRRFPWHQDNGYAFVLPQQYLTCWLPLVPATIENGCPQVVPGLHRHGTLQHYFVDPLGWECFSEPPLASVAAPVVPGDVLVFSSLTPHLTGPNVTDGVRKAYILQYSPVGAVVLEGDPNAGPPRSENPCDSPELHLPVVREGRPVSEEA
jgi:ectoine hydroxylase-related dioxygenase (phytanoyl-CoA dioxygenase family)